jgi:NADH-quinone oxidoreductase subunit I
MILEMVGNLSKVFKSVGSPKATVDIRKGVVHQSPKFRGQHEIDRELCTGCSSCFKICPVEAIAMDPTGEKKPAKIPEVNLAICIFCGLCEDACPTKPEKAIKLSGGTYKIFTDGDHESQSRFIQRAKERS